MPWLNIPESFWFTQLNRVTPECPRLPETFQRSTRTSWPSSTPKQTPAQNAADWCQFSVRSPVWRRSGWCHGWDGDRKRHRKPIKNTNSDCGEREQWPLVISRVHFMCGRKRFSPSHASGPNEVFHPPSLTLNGQQINNADTTFLLLSNYWISKRPPLIVRRMWW